MNTEKSVRAIANQVGLAVHCSRPGDGMTRYEIGVADLQNPGCFKPGSVFFCGASAAIAYLHGFGDGRDYERRIDAKVRRILA